MAGLGGYSVVAERALSDGVFRFLCLVGSLVGMEWSPG